MATTNTIDNLALAVDHFEREMNRRFDEHPRVFATKDDLLAETNRYIGWMVVWNATLVLAVSVITILR